MSIYTATAANSGGNLDEDLSSMEILPAITNSRNVPVMMFGLKKEKAL